MLKLSRIHRGTQTSRSKLYAFASGCATSRSAIVLLPAPGRPKMISGRSAAAVAIVVSSRMELCIAQCLTARRLASESVKSLACSNSSMDYYVSDRLASLGSRCCRMRRARRSTLLAACKTLECQQNANAASMAWDMAQRITKNQNLRNPEQPGLPRLGFGRQRRARQDVLLDQPSERVALAQFGVQRHGYLPQGLAEGPVAQRAVP